MGINIYSEQENMKIIIYKHTSMYSFWPICFLRFVLIDRFEHYVIGKYRLEIHMHLPQRWSSPLQVSFECILFLFVTCFTTIEISFECVLCLLLRWMLHQLVLYIELH